MLTILLKYKKLIIAGFLPFVFWGALIALWFFRAPESLGSQSPANNNNGGNDQLSISQLAESQNMLDSDHDGLPDWEEAIYGTDPHNPDTDGDGYLDGEEVLSGHDPLKKGPDDLIRTKVRPLTKKAQDEKTATDVFAKVALVNFFNNKDIQDFSNTTPEQLDAKLKKSFENNPESTKEFQQAMRDTLYDFVPIGLDEKIKILDTSSEKDEQVYMEKFKKMMDEASSKSGKYTKYLHEIISDAFERKDLSQIDDAAKSYMFLYETMLRIPAPKSIAEAHHAGLLIFYETAIALEAIKNWETDPVRAIIAIKKLAAWNEKLDQKTSGSQQNP